MDPATEAALKKKKKKIYRGSSIIYSNVFNAIALDRSAEPMHNPYYAMSWTFMPQIWLRDDMYLRARLGLEVELTVSDSTDTTREPVLSDLHLDYGWRAAYTIPVAKIVLTPSLRLSFPTSKISQGRSMLFALAPGLSFSRGFKLHGGKWFNSLAVMYGFRYTKYFHEYTNAQIDISICGNPTRPECQHSGRQNVSSRFTNSFTVRANAHPRLILTATVGLYNDLTYSLPAGVTEAGVPYNAVDNFHRAALYTGFTATVPVLKWLFIDAGFSSFHSQLTPDSSYRAPLFNRYTAFMIDITVPIDAFVGQVESWMGSSSAQAKNKKNKPTRTASAKR